MGVGSQATKTNTIARYDIALTIPKDDVNSFAQAVSILYAKIRSANAGSINYSVEDLSAYILNVRSIRVALNQIRRMLESTYVTDPYNANIPILLTNAASGYQISGANRIGCDFETISSNAATLHNKLIIWYKLIGSLLPVNLNLLDRADWLFSNIFRDSMGAKPSVFIPFAGSVPHYTASGASLSKTDVKLQNTSTSFEDNFKTMISNVDKFIQNITTLNANVIIAGDILKAFGDNAFFNQSMDPLGTPANIIYDEAALTQFQNASVLGAAQDKYTSETYNFETGAHTLTLTIPTTYYGLSRYAPKNVLINTYKDSMTPAETISYSRFSVVNTYASGVITIETCGSEIMKDIIYYTIQESNGLFTTYAWSSMVLGTTSTAMYIINAWAYLDYSPMLFMLLSENENTLMFDFNKYAVCTKAELSTYHQYATLSLLASQAHVKRQNEFNFIQ
nr:putative capsid protein [Picobirnavirus sp.]